MNFTNYLEKLRAKPEAQRERIAVFATAAAFFLFFAIWLISFSETGRIANKEQEAAPGDQLEDIQNSLSRNQQSIEEMMESLPEEEFGAEESDVSGEQPEIAPKEEQESAPVQGEDIPPGAEDKAEVPQLP